MCRNLLKTALLLSFVISQVMAEPTVAKSWKEATERAKTEQKDILVFFHGSNWNRLGEKFRHKIWDTAEFKNQLGENIITLRLDLLDSPDEQQKKAWGEAVKGLKLKLPSYPGLVMYDSEGRKYATWTGSDFPLMTSQAVAMIQHQEAQRQRRDGFLDQAKKQEGEHKAEFLFLAIDCDAGLRAELVKQLKACDPENNTGYLGLVDFSGKGAMAKANKLAGEKKFEEALLWLDEQWAQAKLNTEQKQWILAAKGNVYRRWGEHLPEMYEVMMQSYQLDPNSVIGKASYRMAKRFAGPPSLEFGWDSRHCESVSTLWTIDASGEFGSAGHYEVTFLYKRGKSALDISSVALYDGDQLIKEDKHDGRTGRQSNNNVYQFSVARKVVKPTLRIQCHTDTTKNCQGRIEVKSVPINK